MRNDANFTKVICELFGRASGYGTGEGNVMHIADFRSACSVPMITAHKKAINATALTQMIGLDNTARYTTIEVTKVVSAAQITSMGLTVFRPAGAAVSALAPAARRPAWSLVASELGSRVAPLALEQPTCNFSAPQCGTLACNRK